MSYGIRKATAAPELNFSLGRTSELKIPFQKSLLIPRIMLLLACVATLNFVRSPELENRTSVHHGLSHVVERLRLNPNILGCNSLL
jgi:hypothetical protein